ncbi:MAG: integrase, partial [Pseudaminobacter sp.]
MNHSDLTDDDELPDIIGVVMQMGQQTQTAEKAPSPALPATASETERLPGHLERLTERARDYVEAASSANTRRAYGADWKHFSSWCRRQGFATLPPDPQVVGLYI